MNAPAHRTVRLVDVPVDLYERAHQHTDDLLRELVIMAAHHAAPGRVTALARLAGDQHAARDALRVSARQAVDAAAARGDAHVTLTFTVDGSVAESSETWSALLDEMAELCRDGTMLSVPAEGEVAAFSRWFCSEFVAQLRDGAEPRSWPEYAAAERSVPAR